MPSDRLRRARRIVWRTAAIVAATGLVAFLCFLPFAGRYLVHEDPMDRADAVFVLAGARAERWLEAVDLYREGRAPRIVLSAGRMDAAEARIRKMGIRFPSDAELARDAMLQMNVPAGAVGLLPESLDNTAQEAMSLYEMARAAGWRRIIIVTSKYHTRRTGFAFRREFQGSGVEVLIRASRYDASTPHRWWNDRSDIRLVGFELQKLIAYRLGLGG